MTDIRLAAEAAHRDGFTYFDQMGSRAVSGGFEIWLRVLEPITFQARVIKGEIAASDELTSVSDLWGGAAWAEAEIIADIRRAAGPLTSSGGSPHLERP